MIQSRYNTYSEYYQDDEDEEKDIEIKTKKIKNLNDNRNPNNNYQNVDFLTKLKQNNDKDENPNKRKNEECDVPKKKQKVDVAIKERSWKLDIISPKRETNSAYWLDDLHIDKVLNQFKSLYKDVKIYTNEATNIAFLHSQFSDNLLHIENLIFVLHSIDHWVVVTNIDVQSELGKPYPNKTIFVYDSLNNPYYISGLQKFFATMFRTDNYIDVEKVYMYYPQEGCNDCGLFVLAYVQSLCQAQEPSLVEYDQNSM